MSRTRTQLVRQDIDALGGPDGKATVILDSDVAGLFPDGYSMAADGTVAHTRSQAAHRVVILTRAGRGKTQPRDLSWDSAPKFGLAASPDGSQIAYSTVSAKGAMLVTRGVDPLAGVRVVTSLHDTTSAIAWSPKGDRLAYVDGPSPAAARIHVVSASGGKPAPLATKAPIATMTLAWGTGEMFAFQHPGNTNIDLLDPATLTIAPLLDKPVGWMFVPKFSPDGSSVAVYWNKGDGRTLGPAVVDLGTRKMRALRGGPALPLGWSKDSKWLFVASPNDAGQIIRVDPATGEAMVWIDMPRAVRGVREFAFLDPQRIVLLLRDGGSDIWISRPKPTP